MKIEFTLPVKPFSVNSMYYGSRRVKTKECRAWEIIVREQLMEIKDLVDLADVWRAEGGIFHVEYEFVYPYRIIFNEQKLPSSKAFDISNTEKLLQDLIFDVMGINDKYVFSMCSNKRPGPTHEINVKLELHAEYDAA